MAQDVTPRAEARAVSTVSAICSQIFQSFFMVVWWFWGFVVLFFGVAALNIVQTLFEHDVKCFVMFVKCLNDVEEQSDDQIKGIQNS